MQKRAYRLVLMPDGLYLATFHSPFEMLPCQESIPEGGFPPRTKFSGELCPLTATLPESADTVHKSTFSLGVANCETYEDVYTSFNTHIFENRGQWLEKLI